MNSHRGTNHCAGYLIDAGNEDDCGAGHWLSPCIDHYQPRTVSSVIADCLLGDEYVKLSTAGDTEEHRAVIRSRSPLWSSVSPVVKIFAGGEELPRPYPPSLTKLFKNILAS